MLLYVKGDPISPEELLKIQMAPMKPRSLKPEVRNPLLKLPAMARLITFIAANPELRSILRDLLQEIIGECRLNAQHCWTFHKAPMAAYWKVCSVYAGHIRRAI